MNEERLLILKMLEQGKISAEEAAALLEALEDRGSEEMEDAGGGGAAGDGATQPPGNDTAHDRGHENKVESNTMESTAAGDSNADWENRIQELGRKAEEWGREVAESVTRFAGCLQETVEQKLVPGLENLDEWVSAYKLRYLRQWHPELSIDRQYRGRFAPRSAASGATESEMLPVLIRLATRNGSIKITATPEQEYVLRIHGRVRPEARPAAAAEAGATGAAAATAAAVEGWLDSLVRRALSDEGIQLDLNDPLVVALHIELALPQEHRYQLSLNSVNGSATVSGRGLRSSTATVETVNGGVSIQGLAAEYVRAATRNGGISLSDLRAGRGEASTANGGISASLLGLEGEWQLLTRNGGISVSLLNAGYSLSPARGKWRIQTTNGGISVVCPSGALPPILFRAQTRMGKVQVEAAPVVFRRMIREHGRHYVEGFLGGADGGAGAGERGAAGESAGVAAGVGGADSSQEFQLELETTNGSIVLRQG